MRIRQIMAIPILVLALAGCIKEDMSGCFVQENVKFLFTYGGERGVEFTKHIQKIDLFLFDSDGKYLLYRSVGIEELSPGNPSLSFALDPGTYHALAWANVGNNSAYQSLTPGVTSLEECLVEINSASTRTGDPVNYAPRKERRDETDTDSGQGSDIKIYEVVVPPGVNVEKTLDFVRAHRTIYVWIRGFQDTGGLYPTVEAKGLWCRYDFTYRTRAFRRNFLQQGSSQTMDGVEYAVATFHHAYGKIDNDMNIYVTRTSDGELSHTVSVRQFLEDNPSSSTDDIHIMLTFSYDLGVKVSLPHWIADEVEPGVD